MQTYPVELHEDDNNTVLATFPDLPEAVTFGEDEDEALMNGVGALTAVIAARMDDREDIPLPSAVRPGQPAVTLPALVAVKAAIYRAMREQNVSKAELARRLGQNPRQVDRLLDVTHSSRHDQLDRALAVLGKRLAVQVENAA